jgi:hypothetical protein
MQRETWCRSISSLRHSTTHHLKAINIRPAKAPPASKFWDILKRITRETFFFHIRSNHRRSNHCKFTPRPSSQCITYRTRRRSSKTTTTPWPNRLASFWVSAARTSCYRSTATRPNYSPFLPIQHYFCRLTSARTWSPTSFKWWTWFQSTFATKLRPIGKRQWRSLAT